MNIALDLYTDGSIRTSAKRAGIGGWICTRDCPEDIHDAYSVEIEYLKVGINTIEYESLLYGLTILREHTDGPIRVFSDSQVAVKQILGEYAVRAWGLKARHQKAHSLLSKFESWELTHIHREHNKLADLLAGKATGRPDALKKPLPFNLVWDDAA